MDLDDEPPIISTPLHLASTIAELDRMASIKTFGIPLATLCKSSETLFNVTIDASKQVPRDEEKVYVQSQRYLQLLKNIRRYVNDESFFHSRFKSSANQILEIRNKTLDSLKHRYLLSPKMSKPDEEAREAARTEVIQTLPPVLVQDEKDFFITPQVFYNTLTVHAPRVLVIDIRPTYEYKECKLKFKNKNVLWVPGDNSFSGLTPFALQRQLESVNSANCELFKKRNQFDVIILVDGGTTRHSYATSNLNDFRIALMDWDLEPKKGLPPFVLEGGIKALADSYPTLLTNPNKFYKTIYVGFDDFIEEEEEIAYPDIGELMDPIMDENVIMVDIPSDDETGIPSNDPIQNMLNYHVNLVQTAEQLCQYQSRRIQIKKQFLDDRLPKDTAITEVLDLNDKMSKSEYFYIELNERIKMLTPEFTTTGMRSEGESALSCMMDITTLEKKHLEKHEARRKLAVEEAAMDNLLLEKTPLEGEELNIIKYAPSKPVKSPQNSPRPAEPDRSTKPAPAQSETALQLLNNRFRGSGNAGLVNLNNTCYMNSIVQCLRFCPQFMVHFVEKDYDHLIQPLSFGIGTLMNQLWEQNHMNALKPTIFYAIVTHLEGGTFSRGDHEDAQEFFVFLLKYLHTETNEELLLTPDCSNRLREWRTTFFERTSFVHRTFFYQVEGSSLCPHCKSRVVKYDYGNTLFISLPETGEPISLQESFNEFLVVQDDDTFVSKFCSNCEKMTKAEKVIGYYPPVLAVNIVRYTYSKTERCIIRLNNPCDFGLQMKFGQATYELRALSLHTGNRDRGHYTAIAFHHVNSAWVYFNDECVRFADIHDSHLRVQCYMLFYTLAPSCENINKNFFGL